MKGLIQLAFFASACLAACSAKPPGPADRVGETASALQGPLFGVKHGGSSGGDISAGDAGFSSNNALPSGGPVLANVKIVSVYWGPNVNPTVVSTMGPFYTAMTNSTYMDLAAEYSTPTQTIGRGTLSQSVTITPTITRNPVRDDLGDVSAELASQINAGNLPAPDTNTLYAVHFPPGVVITAPLNQGNSCAATYCAYHYFGVQPVGAGHFPIVYSVMPDFGPGSGCDVGCGGGTMIQNFTSAASHEVMEAVTDPQPFSGWWNEIGDPCAFEEVTLPGTSYKVQKIWSDDAAACVATPRLCSSKLKGCLGGTCNGLCQPITLASPSSTWLHVRADATNVYWDTPTNVVSSTSIYSHGDTGSTVYTAPTGSMFGLALPQPPSAYASNVYSLASNPDNAVYLGITNKTTLSSTSALLNLYGSTGDMVFDETNSWLYLTGQASGSNNSLLKVKPDGSSMTYLLTNLGVNTNGVYLGMDTQNAYVPDPQSGRVLYCSLSSANCGSGNVAMSGILSPQAAFSDGTNLWVAGAGSSSNIYKCPAGSNCGTPAPFASGQDQTYAAQLIADAKYVYWVDDAANAGAGKLMRCPLGGCGSAPTTWVNGLSFPSGMAQDKWAVYFVDSNGIHKVAK